jgi:NitT/TauT family transport system substrate-binding protein
VSSSSGTVCALELERIAQSLVDRGFAPRYDSTLEVIKELPYNKWREYDPEDTVRFYALGLHEVGMMTSNPRSSSSRAPTGASSLS